MFPRSPLHSLLLQTDGLFPPIGKCDEFGGSLSRMWNSQERYRELLTRVDGETAGECCHVAATILHSASLEEAADVIVRKRVHRLAVLDDNGCIVGVLSRGNLLAVTLAALQAKNA